MITNLQKVDAQIIPGREIQVVEYSLNNYRLHQVLEQLSRLFLFLTECDSNNTSSKARPRDIRRVVSQWNIVKDELEFSMTHNDLPDGVYEYGFKINLIDQKEIQRIRNVKVKRVISEMFNCARVILSVDSAKTQTFISEDDAEDIRLSFTVVDDCVARWLGDGSDASNTGVVAPAYEELGEIQPDVDGDWASISEPSKSGVEPKLPDVQDVP